MEKLPGGIMKKVFILIMCMFLLASLVYGQMGQIEVKRELPVSVQPDQNVEIKLNIKITGEVPSGLIIGEEVPKGWEISSPAGGVLREGRLSFLIYGNDVKDKTLVYTLKSPKDLKKNTLMVGAWETVLAHDMIQGDNLLVLEQKPKWKSFLPVIITVGVLIIITLLVIFLRKKKSKKK